MCKMWEGQHSFVPSLESAGTSGVHCGSRSPRCPISLSISSLIQSISFQDCLIPLLTSFNRRFSSWTLSRPSRYTSSGSSSRARSSWSRSNFSPMLERGWKN